VGENQCATSIEASNCLPQWSLLKLSLTKLRCTRRETFMTPPIDENNRDLGEYYEKFAYPKLRANVAYRIGRKP